MRDCAVNDVLHHDACRLLHSYNDDHVLPDVSRADVHHEGRYVVGFRDAVFHYCHGGHRHDGRKHRNCRCSSLNIVANSDDSSNMLKKRNRSFFLDLANSHTTIYREKTILLNFIEV